MKREVEQAVMAYRVKCQVELTAMKAGKAHELAVMRLAQVGDADDKEEYARVTYEIQQEYEEKAEGL